MTGRFAPSPTGAMHLGNARTALLAWLHSRAHDGRHLLRFEDLDLGRVRPWAYELARRDLAWLGLDWDAEYIQSEDVSSYATALTRLLSYPCTCTRKAIQASIHASAGAPHGTESVYPGTCRAAVHSYSHSAAHSPARPAATRWHVPPETVCVTDSLTGETLCQSLPDDVGDFVLRRSDGVFAYHLAVVVDDAAAGVTDVLRGADLWPATPRQVALQRALGLPTPRYLHVPLMTDYQGERLAKRGGAPPVQALREGGELPGRVLSALARSLLWPAFQAVPEQVTAAELLPLWREVVAAAPQPTSTHG